MAERAVGKYMRQGDLLYLFGRKRHGRRGGTNSVENQVKEGRGVKREKLAGGSERHSYQSIF